MTRISSSIFEGIGEMFKIRQNYKLLLEKMNIKNPVLDYIRYKHLNWYGHVRIMNEEKLPKIFWNGDFADGGN